ncbi:hypothetical protein [Antrihabitans stalactiti]|uniref:Uncharacterized protein n=1 Tax=Antrihabitans stalactiti TaxID=2584121 RepID=A0A848KCY3_9NOCA|nr:hypothetical protein [Antrihabitans stalactiti]NMN96705.1 hypothetical protein [Antrihabitans stalactiti]
MAEKVISIQDRRPLWRKAFDSAERTATPWLEELFESDDFHAALGRVTQTRRELHKLAESTSREILHRFNLPAGSDVTRILAEIGRLHTEVRQLSADLSRLRNE